MNKKSKFIISIIFEIIIVIIGFIGIGIEMGLFTGNINFNLLYYYTILSNLLCIIYIFIKIILKIKNRKNLDYQFMKNFRGSIILCILVTGLVFHFLLSKSFDMVAGTSVSLHYANLIVHYYIPGMMIIDWLLFDKKGYYKKIDPLKWLLIPLTYLFFSLICGLFRFHDFGNNTYYPYFFLDIDTTGILGVLGYVTVLILFFIGLGYILYFIDKKLTKKKS